MSRLAKKPAALPKGVEVKLVGKNVEVKGPKGKISFFLNEGVTLNVEAGQVNIGPTEALTHMPFLGLDRSRLNNAITGVTDGFKKTLELVGVGYRAALKGKTLGLSLGFSHPSDMAIPEGLTVEVEKNTVIHVSGVDKALVGQFCATVRAKRPPEPYKGKGVKYSDEHIKRKAGKKAK